MCNKSVKIIAMGKYLPKQVSSVELEERLGIQNGWSLKNSGVEYRHHVTTECNGVMGAVAIQRALDKANLKLSDIDMLISAGATFDYAIPNQASVIKKHLKDGDKIHIPALDVNTTCLSFISACEISASLLDGENYKNIIIISSEIASKGLNPKSKETSTLFGDAAIATILSFDNASESRFIKAKQRTYSEGVYHTMIKGGGLKYYPSQHPYNQELYSFAMNGKSLLKLAKKKLPQFVDDFYKNLPFNVEETSVVIPHQTSKLGFSLFNKLINLRNDQSKSTLEKYGNCIAASIPLTLYDCIDKGEINRGDTCLLIGTSAGFSIGALLIRY